MTKDLHETQRRPRDGPIGVFDSGLGGLSVVRHLRRLMPWEDIVYFGDTARVPYGGKSAESVRRFSRENCRFLVSRGVRMIVVACNTSSALALPALREEFDVPFYDVISPGARRAVEKCRGGAIGVIGTYATILSGAYERAISDLDDRITVHSVPCPLFVPLAEEGWTTRPATLEIAREYLLPLKAKGMDTLILGCTHYPVLMETIRLVVGNGTELIDTGLACAEEVRECERAGRRREREGTVDCFVSDMPQRFMEMGSLFLGEELEKVSVFDPAECSAGEGSG